MRAVIFDIDGTLADVEHRRPYLPNWGKFFGAQHLDPVIEPVAWLAKVLYWFCQDNHVSKNIIPNQRADVLIVSARPEDYREVTQNWLTDNNIYGKLYMRKQGDYREDSIVKREILQQILDDGYEPFLVVDDRPQVVKMWREYGLVTLQCAPDEILPKHDGKHLLDIMVGPSGAGKSTYVAKHYSPHQVIATDDIREQLFGSKEAREAFTPDGLARTFRLAHSLMRARLECGEFTVFDATNLKRNDRMKVLNHVPVGQFVRYVVIDRRYEQKVETRGWRSEELVKKHHRTFHDNLKDILAGDQQPNVVVIDKRLK